MNRDIYRCMLPLGIIGFSTKSITSSFSVERDYAETVRLLDRYWHNSNGYVSAHLPVELEHFTIVHPVEIIHETAPVLPHFSNYLYSQGFHRQLCGTFI